MIDITIEELKKYNGIGYTNLISFMRQNGDSLKKILDCYYENRYKKTYDIYLDNVINAYIDYRRYKEYKNFVQENKENTKNSESRLFFVLPKEINDKHNYGYDYDFIEKPIDTYPVIPQVGDYIYIDVDDEKYEELYLDLMEGKRLYVKERTLFIRKEIRIDLEFRDW